ncbi:hypothetical protein PsYK624_121970 [Phanerochaete sordida]|uniref:Uncharacterized protein n=1 Tax=Phanerochaete sordida TaxID=48140 RepID=A0A9P3GM72_9APHY|nr:hypothetical protein PsYK624_121970 [Phanerochaete sordida]
MPTPVWFESPNEKTWLENRLLQDAQQDPANMAAYRERIAREFLAKFPGTPTPREILKNKKVVRVETEDEAQARCSRRYKQCVTWIKNHRKIVLMGATGGTGAPEFIRLDEYKPEAHVGRARSARDIYISDHPEIGRAIRSSAAAEGLSKAQLCAKVNDAYTEALKADPARADYERRSNDEKAQKAAERATMKEKREAEQADQPSDSAGRTKVLNDLEFTLSQYVCKLAAQTQTEILVLYGGRDAKGFLRKWLLSSRQGQPEDIVGSILLPDHPAHSILEVFDDYLEDILQDSDSSSEPRAPGGSTMPAADPVAAASSTSAPSASAPSTAAMPAVASPAPASLPAVVQHEFAPPAFALPAIAPPAVALPEVALPTAAPSTCTTPSAALPSIVAAPPTCMPQPDLTLPTAAPSAVTPLALAELPADAQPEFEAPATAPPENAPLADAPATPLVPAVALPAPAMPPAVMLSNIAPSANPLPHIAPTAAAHCVGVSTDFTAPSAAALPTPVAPSADMPHAATTPAVAAQVMGLPETTPSFAAASMPVPAPTSPRRLRPRRAEPSDSAEPPKRKVVDSGDSNPTKKLKKSEAPSTSTSQKGGKRAGNKRLAKKRY